MFALRSEDIWPKIVGEYAYAFPDRRYPEAHADGKTAVEVTVTEDPDGPYWGWLDDPDGGHWKPNDYPEFIWHEKMAFDMCFAYGPEAEVKAGKGRIVRLRIEEHPHTQGRT
mgnify:CR=1 FL=1